MCGIAGMVHRDGSPVDRGLLAQMVAAMRHRGPDGEGFHVIEPSADGSRSSVGFGHCRLAVIDLAGGAQPMCNEDRTVWVVFNGEIYNYVELRRALEAKGHRFSSNTDTEVIVHQYEEDGVECVQVFRGMFAFALWDGRADRLFLARDRVGKKPLWYAANETRLLFASELQALLADPTVERTVDPEALDAYLLYGYVPSPRSILTGVWKVPPAHRVIWDRQGLRSERYWELPFEPKATISEAEAQERFLELFRDAVRIRLRSDVPLGAFLSGGLDSSSVVAMMAELSSTPIRTFTIGFEDEDYSELAYARQVADRFQTQHHEFIVKPETAAVIPTLVRHYGEPYADSSCLPTFYLAQMTRQHVTVALNGDGGDEVFAGYPRYVAAELSRRLDRLPKAAVRCAGWLLKRLGGTNGFGHTGNRLRQANRFLQAVAEYPDPETRYLRWLSFFMPEERAALYTPAFQAQLSDARLDHWLLDLYRSNTSASVIERLMAVDIASYLPNDLLVKVDIASMAHALEVRSPFLDHHLMEFVARLPLRYKVRGFTAKRLLRRSMLGVLPERILTRSKLGFGVPLGQWLKEDLNPWMREILLDPQALHRGLFRPAAITRLVEEHTKGVRDHRFRLWALIMFELWHDAVLDASPASAREPAPS